MKCRNIIKNGDGTYNIVWFKSYGADIDLDLPTEYATFPIVGRLDLFVDEYPYQMCGFTDIASNKTTTYFNHARPNLQQFYLEVEADDGIQLTFSFYNNNDPTEVFYTKTFTGSIKLNDKLLTNSADLKNIGFSIEGVGITTIRKFWLKISGITTSKKAENYVENEEAVAKSLVQRLAVIKNELWYNINYGLPLLDKIRNKAIIDAAIINIINQHEGVRNIIDYTSNVDQNSHTYYFTSNINTIYNKNISISSEYLM